MLARNKSAAIERTIAEREAMDVTLTRQIGADRASLSDVMDDGARYEAAFAALSAKEARLATIKASLAPLRADLSAAIERERKAQDQANLVAFERRKKRAAPGRRARYDRAAAELHALAQEMEAERDEAESLRRDGLNAQPDISHEVLRYLHLPRWDGAGAIYCPRGADHFALRQAFMGRRP